jgi:hypothetical protein
MFMTFLPDKSFFRGVKLCRPLSGNIALADGVSSSGEFTISL